MTRLLLKNRLKALLYGTFSKSRGGKAVKASAGRIILFSILYLYVAAVFLALTVSMAFTFGSVLIPMGASWLYFAIFSLAALTLIFIFGIFEAKTEIFDSKDNELLLSMPIKPKSIVASRVLMVLFYNYLESAIVLIPATVMYAIFSSFEPLGIVGGLLLFLFIPLLATALSSGVGYLLALVMRRLRNNSFVGVFVAVAFMALYFYGYTALMNGIEGFLANIGGEIENIAENYGILYFLGSAGLLKPLPIILVILISALSFALAYFLISRSYIKLVTANYGVKKSAYKDKKREQKSSLYALTRKEISKFFSSSVYMLNGGIGLIFEVVLAIIAVVNRNTLSEALLAIGLDGILVPAFAIIAVTMSSINMISCCSVSLEGSNLWILKSLPVKAREVLISKALSHFIIVFIPTLVSSVLFFIASGGAIYYLPFFIIIPALANLLFAIFGVVINVALPKFNFENDAVVIKQSLASFVTMMSQLVVSLILSGAGIVLSFISPIISLLAVFAIVTLLTLISWLIMTNVSAKRFEKFNV